MERYASDEVIVRYKKDRINLKDSTGVQRSAKFSKDRKLKAVDTYAKGNFSVMKSSAGESVETLMARLKNDPDVELVQPNFRYYTKSLGTNDAYSNYLWGLDNIGQSVSNTFGLPDADIDAPEAWAVNE